MQAFTFPCLATRFDYKCTVNSSDIIQHAYSPSMSYVAPGETVIVSARSVDLQMTTDSNVNMSQSGIDSVKSQVFDALHINLIQWSAWYYTDVYMEWEAVSPGDIPVVVPSGLRLESQYSYTSLFPTSGRPDSATFTSVSTPGNQTFNPQHTTVAINFGAGNITKIITADHLPSGGQFNEYIPSSASFRLAGNIVFNYAATNPATSGQGPVTRPFSAASVLTCVREATPLTLTLQNSVLDFNNIQTGTTTFITRKLNWSASGAGQVSTWTMTFDTAADNKEGDNILLGNTRVRILDTAGTPIPLATPVNINGVTGSYIFELDPAGALPGISDTEINITLSAN